MTQVIAKTAIIHPNVTLGENVIVEDYCIIGIPVPKGHAQATTIGDNSIIRAGTYIYSGTHIGNNFQSGNKANIRENNVIGNDVSIGTLSVIEHSTEINDNVRIHSQVFIPEFSKLHKNCWIGPNVVMTNAAYPNSPYAKANLIGVIVHENAKVGANTTILPGVELGHGCLVGAGSVVTKDVNCATIVAGNPAIELRKIDY